MGVVGFREESLSLASFCLASIPGGPDRPVVRPDAGVLPHAGQFHQLPGTRPPYHHPGEAQFSAVKQDIARLNFSPRLKKQKTKEKKETNKIR